MTQITHDNLPQAVSHLTEEVAAIKRILQEQQSKQATAQDADKWFSLNELCDYLPGKPAKATIYTKCHLRLIPYKKMGGRLAFLKSEIDSWLKSKEKKTLAELEQEAENNLTKSKRK